jgi:hypothetical protein
VDARDLQRGGRIFIARPSTKRSSTTSKCSLTHPDVRDQKLLLRAGVRRIIHGPSEIDDEWIALMKDSNAYLIPTTLSWLRTPTYYEDPFFRGHVSAAVIARLADPKEPRADGRTASGSAKREFSRQPFQVSRARGSASRVWSTSSKRLWTSA